MPSERLLRASELPPGSRMFPRQGSALTGQEIGEAIIRVVTRLLENEGADRGIIDVVVDELDAQMARGWWRAPHLTFPQAQMHFEVGLSELGPWVFVANELGVQGASSLVKLCVGDWPGGGPPKQLNLGPSRIPDQMREELGLPLTAHFRLPDGSVVLAELADPTAEEVGETRGWFKGPNYAQPEIKPAEPPTPQIAVEPAGLVATPPPAPQVAQAPKAEAKVAPKLVAGKGGRR